MRVIRYQALWEVIYMHYFIYFSQQSHDMIIITPILYLINWTFGESNDFPSSHS